MPYAPPFQDCPLSYQEYEKFQQNQIIVVEIQKKPRNFVTKVGDLTMFDLSFNLPSTGLRKPL